MARVFSIEEPAAGKASDVFIHPTAVVHPSAAIDSSVEIGPYTVIGEDVEVGAGTKIGSHAVVEFSRIGRNCQVHSHAFVGTAPQDLKYRGERTKLYLGDGSIVRECATLNRGTAASGKTVIGKKCLVMAYAHVAHDCQIADEVILANSVAVAGHVKVGFGVVIGGLSGIHQFVHVGRLAMVAAGSMVAQDVPPFTTVWGDRARIVGLNLEGLKRRHVAAESIRELKKIFSEYYWTKKGKTKVADKAFLKANLKPESKVFLEFLTQASRGVCRPRTVTETGTQATW